ncbi:MAG TPA: quinoprotein relay system zinc metallohydrolase 2 [Methylophaga sp.]|nr:quinoprotein relay system zinc metallohydrolase 2 [Methylophaga sp.]
MKCFLLITLLGFTASACAVSTNDYPLQKVADGIYYHQGVHENANAENIGAIANVGFIIGEKCVAIIDSGGSYREGELLRQSLRDITELPVCYVINTHVHPDHILGNAAFADENPIYVGHEKLPAAMASREQHYARNFSESLGDAYTGSQFIPAEMLVSPEQPLTLDLGGRELVLKAYSTAHTDHDLTVLDKQTQTLWTGDLLFRERIPAIDGSINGWIDTLEQLQAKSYQVIIPGHGPAAIDEAADWDKLLDYLTTIREQIRTVINDLGTLDEATATVGLSERQKWELFDEYHRRNVTAAFVELEWE